MSKRIQDLINARTLDALTMRKVSRKCACGLVHEGVPEDARHMADEETGGWYWECSCLSTLFVPDRKPKPGSSLAKLLGFSLSILMIFTACESVPVVSSSSLTTSSTSEPGVKPMAVPTVDPTPEPTVDPAITPTPTVTPSPIVTPTPSATPSPSPTVTPSSSPSPTPSPSPSPSPSATPYAFSGGTGSQSTPYLLETVTDVQNIGQSENSYFSVVQDINMSGINFQPIASFSGTIYGNGKHLYNLSITTTGTTKATLFTVMSGTIVNLIVQNVAISSQSYAGVFAGTLYGLISSCSVSGTITATLGGNGYNTGTGRPTYVTKGTGGSVITTTQQIVYNGNTVNTAAQ